MGGPQERITHDRDGLLFEVGNADSLAQAIRRACSEQGLWQRLVHGIKPPMTEDAMVESFLAVYQGKGGAAAPDRMRSSSQQSA